MTTSIAPSFSRESHSGWLERSKFLIRLSLTFSLFLFSVSCMMNKYGINVSWFFYVMIFLFRIYFFPDFFSGFFDNTNSYLVIYLFAVYSSHLLLLSTLFLIN
jgi:hypothetical protein